MTAEHELLFLLCLVILGSGLLQHEVSGIRSRVGRLARLETKLDLLLRHSGIEYDPLRETPASVRDALERGERILAIKRMREATGMGLKEAKEHVDELERLRRGKSDSGR